MKIGIMGGTFNPLHYGHLRMGEEAREALNLDKIVFIPCFIPPHKGHDDVASSDDRLRMLELALDDNPFFEISDIELKRGGKSYSIETINELKNLYGDLNEIIFIIGMDSYVEIGIWKDYGKLFSATDFAVLQRPGTEKLAESGTPVGLLPVDIREDFCYDAQSRVMEHSSGRKTYFIETTLLDISSSKLRKNIGDGKSVKYLVPPAIGAYIEENSLYTKG